MLIEDLNKMCREFVNSLANTFGNNQNLQMAKLFIANLPDNSKKPLEFITTYLVDHADLISAKDPALFEQKELKEYVNQWNIKTMYNKLPMSSKETFWEDLDEIIKKVKIILCAGNQLDKFESVAQDIVQKTGIRDLPPEEKTIQNVLSKVMTSFLEDPSVASNVGSLMQGLDGDAQERVLKLTGMDHLLPMIKQLQNSTATATPELDHSQNNADYFANKDQEASAAFSSSSDSTSSSSSSSSSTETPTSSETSVTPSTSTSSTSTTPAPPAAPFNFADMNKQMFKQLAAQLQKSGELDSVIEEVKANPDAISSSATPPPFPGMPANMDIKKILESLTGDSGLLASFGKNIPKPRNR